jgi:N-acetylglucosaminyl-diphospho-decaprenol L-rhamnosyltransferase
MLTQSADNSGARFSAVIVNYNGGEMLVDCVRSALLEGMPAKQIVVVDNGSRDISLAGVAKNFPTIQIVRNRCNAGFARAVNQGLAHTTGDFILLLNNDAQLQPGALRAFAEAFDSIPRLAIAGGQLRYPDGRMQNAIARFPTLISELLPHTLLEWIHPDRFKGTVATGNPIEVESVIGACLAVRRAVLATLGLLDEDYFFFYEETEWCQRAQRLGFQVYHLPGARALHLQGGTARHFRGRARVEFQRSKLIFFKKTQTPAVSWCASALVTLATFVDAVVNTTLCVLTCFTVKRLRTKTRVYLYLLAWHLIGRPANWGLPDKCPHSGTTCGANQIPARSFASKSGSREQTPSSVETV